VAFAAGVAIGIATRQWAAGLCAYYITWASCL
jgi:hypothetical protein